jgi:DHA1 family bicyclomycin/chloramphenicol resistance-like MFS transporter
MTVSVGMVPPLLPLIGAGFALSPVEIGLVNTVYALGRLGGSYPGAQARARWGTRAGVLLGIATLTLGGAGCALAPGYGAFLAARFVMGFGASTLFVAIFAELFELAPVGARGRVASAFEGVAIVAMAIGGVLAAGVAPHGGWRGAFATTAGIMLLGLGAWWRIPRTAGRRRAAGRGPSRERAGSAAFRSLAPVYAATFTLAFTWAGLFVTLGPLLGHEQYGLQARGLGLAFAAAYAAELAGLLGIAVILDRVRPEPFFLAGAGAVAAGGLLMGWGPRPATFAVGLVLVGAGFSVWMVPATVLAARAGTPIPAPYLAAYRIALDAGTIAGPLVVGVGAEVVGDRVTAAVAGLVALAGGLALARRRP